MVGNKWVLGIVALIAKSLAVTAQAGFVMNGSFEAPPITSPGAYEYVPGGSTTITGWTTALFGVERFDPTIHAILGPANDGRLCIDLNTDEGVGGGIEQVVSTVTGQDYVLSFFIGTAQAHGRNGWANVSVLVGGGLTQSFTLENHLQTLAWRLCEIEFTAVSSSTTVAFRNYDARLQTFSFVDNVSIRAIPEPSTLAIWGMLGGLGLIAARRRKQRI